MFKFARICLPFFAACGLFFVFNFPLKREWAVFTVTKLLPILVLSITSAYCFGYTRTGQYTTLGILFSALGDYFLASRALCDATFWIGVVPFGLAHIFFTLAYFRGHIWWPAVLFPALAHAHISWSLWSKCTSMMKFLILSYGLFICGSICTSVSHWWLFGKHCQPTKTLSFDNKGPFIRVVGCLVFALSDVILTLTHFYAVEHAHLYIMSTYYSAEMLIFLGNLLEHLAFQDLQPKQLKM